MGRKNGKGRLLTMLGAVLLAAAAGGCGGGGSADTSTGGTASGGYSSFQWDPPRTYVDNTPLDPSRAIDRYELFVTTDPRVDPADEPIVCVSAQYLDGMVVMPVASFDMRNLSSYLEPGALYYVSIRAVGIDNQVSDRTVPIEWANEA